MEEHKEKFKGLSQEQSDELIAKLLYDRLISVPSNRLVGRPVKNKPTRPSTIQRPISMKPKKKQYVFNFNDDDDDDDESIAGSVTSSMIETDFSSESESD